MPEKISNMTLGYELRRLDREDRETVLNIYYNPLGQKPDGSFSPVNALSSNFSIRWQELPAELRQRLETLQVIVAALLPSYEVSVAKSNSLVVRATAHEIFCHYNTSPPTNVPSQLSVLYGYQTQPNQSVQYNVDWVSLSRSQQLVVDNIYSWVKRLSWEHLTNRIVEISGQVAQTRTGHKVFISYKQHSKAEQAAVTLAHRLQQQQIDVWLDKWEIKAGDSVVGKIGQGFKECDACLIFLESQYSSSDWCTKEMNTALTKAINEDFTIIPILVEDCEKPEMLKELKHVNLENPSASEFEQKLAEITDAIYKVDLNPYK